MIRMGEGTLAPRWFMNPSTTGKAVKRADQNIVKKNTKIIALFYSLKVTFDYFQWEFSSIPVSGLNLGHK